MTARAWKPIEVYRQNRYCTDYKGKREKIWSDYRWRIKSRNGKIIAASSEGFSSRAKCLANLRAVCVVGADVVATINEWGEDSFDGFIRDLTARKPK